MNTFVCAVCGEVLPVSMLSKSSLEQAGTRTRTMATAVLDAADLVCELCDEDPEVQELFTSAPGRTEVERFEFSGLSIDPAELQAYYLNN